MSQPARKYPSQAKPRPAKQRREIYLAETRRENTQGAKRVTKASQVLPESLTPWEREMSNRACQSIDRALFVREHGPQGQEMAGENMMRRRMDELQAIVSALRERVELISEWHLRLNDRLNELGRPATVEASNR